MTSNNRPDTAVIGSGFSGLSAACYLAKAGHRVTLYEKNESAGGRARQFQSHGFTFDMGPSWYWMPDVIADFFADFGKKPEDYYSLVKLDPGFRIYYGKDDLIDIPADPGQVSAVFEAVETGGGASLEKFLSAATEKYRTGMKQLAYKPGLSVREFINWPVLKGLMKLDLTQSFDQYVNKYFKNERLRRLMEFPVLFLGAPPSRTPALYSLMHHAAFIQGTWYPMGGMHQIVKAQTKLAQELGVKIETNAAVSRMNTHKKKIASIQVQGQDLPVDLVVSSADYHHTEMNLLTQPYRNYTETYWKNRTLAPSSLIFYIGLSEKVEGLLHHTLLFDKDLAKHSMEIYNDPRWPTDPLFYVCTPSKTDPTVAPPGQENMFILMPIAPGITDTEALREKYFRILIDRMEKILKTDIHKNIVYKRSYCINNFTEDYHAFKGNAYGLANTLNQTAIFKPKIRNRKLSNLFYAGHLTVPGPGVPPAIISGKIVSKQIEKMMSK